MALMSKPQIASNSASRVNTRVALRTRTSSRENSVRVRCSGRPPRHASNLSGSTRTSANERICDSSSPGARRRSRARTRASNSSVANGLGK